MGKIPSRGSDQFVLRFPPGLRDQIREVSEKNGRSMNAEIIDRLTESLETDVVARSPEASFEAMKPFLDALNGEWSKRYEVQMAAMKAILGTIAGLVKEGKATDVDLERLERVLDPKQGGKDVSQKA